VRRWREVEPGHHLLDVRLPGQPPALAVLCGRLKRHDDAIRHGLKVCELEPNEPFSFTAISYSAC